MTLLAPLFLAGLATIALPIWLHRLKTQSPEREPFSSTMLLEASEQRVHVRRELRYWLLLCLRILFLALLALSFAKPVLERPPAVIAGAAPILNLIVVDASLSMGYGERMVAARAAARDIIDGMGDGDRGQVIAASSGITVLVGPSGDLALLDSAVASLQNDSGRLDLGTLEHAGHERACRTNRLHVHSDRVVRRQRTSQPVMVQHFDDVCLFSTLNRL